MNYEQVLQRGLVFMKHNQILNLIFHSYSTETTESGPLDIQSGTLQCKEWAKRLANLIRNVSGTFIVNSFDKYYKKVFL